MPDPTQTAPNYDTSADEKELAALRAELDQARTSIEGDFAKVEAEKFSKDTKFQELCFEKPEEFFKEVLQDQNNYLAQNIEPKIAKAKELDSAINEKKQFASIDAAVNEFKKNHPDADINELMRFFSEEVPPKVQNELQGLPPQQFFEALYALYNQMHKKPDENDQNAQNQSNEPKRESLPQQIGGVPSNAANASSTSYSQNAFDRF